MDLLILGASARAAAHSARRAGLRPGAVDLFADRDLAALGPVRRVSAADYPAGLEALAASSPPGPWIFTGALENHPALVDRIAAERPLWGNRGEILRAVRDPGAWTAALTRAGLPAPAARSSPAGLPRDGSWLVKPLASAGGRGIRALGPDDAGEGRPVYYQERLAGPSLAAVFLGRGRGAGATLLGVTRQRIGRPGQPFAYTGSVGPWTIGDILRGRIATVGEVLSRAFGLAGLFGVDLVLCAGWPWTIEVNPRYTASVEVLELALGRSLLALHRQAFEPEAREVPDVVPTRLGPVGKAILFADVSCTLTGPLPLPGAGPFEVPAIADVPPPGARFEAGEPVLTVFARGRSPEDCARRLGRHLDRWRRRLRPEPASHLLGSAPGNDRVGGVRT